MNKNISKHNECIKTRLTLIQKVIILIEQIKSKDLKIPKEILKG